jgi:subtilisin family serine protease
MAHSGTSMASPVVAGVLAQLKSLAPDASHVQIIEALSSGGHEVEELKLRVKSGKMVDSYLAIDSLQKLLAPVLAEAL